MTKNKYAKELAEAKYRQRTVPSKRRQDLASKERAEEELKRWWERRNKRYDNDNSSS